MPLTLLRKSGWRSTLLLFATGVLISSASFAADSPENISNTPLQELASDTIKLIEPVDSSRTYLSDGLVSMATGIDHFLVIHAISNKQITVLFNFT